MGDCDKCSHLLVVRCLQWLRQNTVQRLHDVCHVRKKNRISILFSQQKYTHRIEQ